MIEYTIQLNNCIEDQTYFMNFVPLYRSSNIIDSKTENHTSFGQCEFHIQFPT